MRFDVRTGNRSEYGREAARILFANYVAACREAAAVAPPGLLLLSPELHCVVRSFVVQPFVLQIAGISGPPLFARGARCGFIGDTLLHER